MARYNTNNLRVEFLKMKTTFCMWYSSVGKLKALVWYSVNTLIVSMISLGVIWICFLFSSPAIDWYSVAK